MLARSRLVLLSALVLSFTAASSLGCAAEATDEEASLAANDPATDLKLASWNAFEARTGSDEKDVLLAQLLSRVAPALDGKQHKAVVEAFEARGDVKAVREKYLSRSHDLAVKLDAIHRDAALAKTVSNEPGILMAAYEQLAETPFSAGAVRFGGVLLALTDDSPYANMKQLGQIEARGAKLLAVGLPAALVERSVVQADVDKGLADVRAYLGDANGKAGVLLGVIADRKTLLSKTKLGEKVVVAGGDLGPAVRAMGGVLSVWQAAEDLKDGDIVGLIQSGPGGVVALMEGTNALRHALGASNLVWAEQAAKVAGRIGAGVGIVMATVGAIQGLQNLDSTDAKIRTLGNCLVLAGSFIALTGGSGALLIAAGTAATILADILAGPKPDELRPLLEAAVLKGVLPKEAVEPLANCLGENVRLLARDFELTPPQVLWTIVHAPGAAATNIDQYRSLSAIAKVFGVKGAKMDALLKKVASDPDPAKSTMMLSEFLRFTWDRSKLWESRTRILADLDAVPKELRVDVFDKAEYGIDASVQLTGTKRAIANARAYLATVK